MAIPVGGKFATFVFQVEGNDHGITTSIGIIDLDAISPRTNEELAALVRTNWTQDDAPFQASQMNNVTSLVNVTVTEMTADGPISAVVGPAVDGTIATDPPPINCAILVNKVTASGGRRNKGRMYFPPAMRSEATIDQNGVISSAGISAVQILVNNAFDADIADDIAHVLFHQTGSDTPTGITSLDVQSRLATQRRRMRG